MLPRSIAVLVCAITLAIPHSAGAVTLWPPAGKVLTGISGGETVGKYATLTGAHPAVFQFFTAWGADPDYVLKRTNAARSRAMFHISTQSGSGREIITPAQIAAGHGDEYLVRLTRALGEHGKPVFIRLMAEMNGYWNVYSAFDANGRSRGASHSTAAFKRAWKRTVIVVRGGSVEWINRRLRAERLPRLDTRQTRLPRPRVAFQWVPQVAGAPDTAANAPIAYWPGRKYVDWVGTDFYSKFPNWAGLERFYGQFRGKPFVFAEWAIWGADDPAFAARFFAWVKSHRRVRMIVYNQGVRSAGPFRLTNYPRAARVIRSELRSAKFLGWVPEELGP